MKALLLSLTLLTFSTVQASAHDYQCIADNLQAYNSDIFYNLSVDEINEMLNDVGAYGHDLAVETAKRCDLEAK